MLYIHISHKIDRISWYYSFSPIIITCLMAGRQALLRVLVVGVVILHHLHQRWCRSSSVCYIPRNIVVV